MGKIGFISLFGANPPSFPPPPPPQYAGRLENFRILEVIFVPDVAICTLFQPQSIVKLILLRFRRQCRFSKFPYFDIIYALRAAIFKNTYRLLKLPYMGLKLIQWQKVT